MKVSKRDISIVMVLLGVIALFCVYQFYYRDSQKKVEELQASIDKSTAENNELLKIDETKLESDMTAAEKDLKAMVLEYPMAYRLDDMIMYLYDLEKAPAYGAHFVEYLMTPSEPRDAYIGSVRDKTVTYSVSDAKFSMIFTNETYTGLKEMLKAVYADRYAKNFDYIRLKYDNLTGVVHGEITLHALSVTDRGSLGQGDETNWRDIYPEVMIPQVKMGVDCVFGPTVTPVPTLELENPEE